MLSDMDHTNPKVALASTRTEIKCSLIGDKYLGPSHFREEDFLIVCPIESTTNKSIESMTLIAKFWYSRLLAELDVNKMLV